MSSNGMARPMSRRPESSTGAVGQAICTCSLPLNRGGASFDRSLRIAVILSAYSA